MNIRIVPTVFVLWLVGFSSALAQQDYTRTQIVAVNSASCPISTVSGCEAASMVRCEMNTNVYSLFPAGSTWAGATKTLFKGFSLYPFVNPSSYKVYFLIEAYPSDSKVDACKLIELYQKTSIKHIELTYRPPQ